MDKDDAPSPPGNDVAKPDTDTPVTDAAGAREPAADALRTPSAGPPATAAPHAGKSPKKRRKVNHGAHPPPVHCPVPRSRMSTRPRCLLTPR